MPTGRFEISSFARFGLRGLGANWLMMCTWCIYVTYCSDIDRRGGVERVFVSSPFLMIFGSRRGGFAVVRNII